MYYRRHIEDKIKLYAKHFKVVLILGARQVGKSTVLQHVLPELKHIVFDPITDEFLARSDPELFLQNFTSPVILDEIQYVPELLPVIKRHVDKSNAKGQYFLTGSHNFSMLKQIAESLAGRVGIIELPPLSLYEFTNNDEPSWLYNYLNDAEQFTMSEHELFSTHPKNLFEIIWRGGMPGILEFPDNLLTDYFKSYLQTYLERDVRTVATIDDLTQFSQFAGILAALTAQEINYTYLGREVGIQAKTVARWLNIMKTCYQWHEVLPYHGNVLKRLSKKRKGYLFDTGIACYLQNIFSHEALMKHPHRGALFETWVVNQIKILFNTLPFTPQVYHWRTNGGAEIDVILEKDGVFYPIEIKCSVQLSRHDAAGIMAFIDTYPKLNIAPGLIIYAGDTSYRINARVTAISWRTLQ